LAPAPAFVAGRYVLRERLGAGAVGEVWSAEDPQIGRRVAIKFLRPPDELDEKDRAEWENRFLLEARAAGRLSHPGIVSIHDVGTASDGCPFIVMEVVEGRNLEALRTAKPHPTLEQIIRWTIEVAEALEAAHRRNVVHRDIKPANILIGTDGRARITDFGIARVAESDLTRDGFFLGSPAFASPEQLCGEKIDGRADLFSLGAVLYLLATRRRPFEGEAIGTIAYAACHSEPPRPSSVNPALSPALDSVILRALEKKPELRFQSGGELAGALRAAAVDKTPSDVSAATVVERTISSRSVSAAPTAEDRAVSIASAIAVSVVRASRAAATETRRLASAFMEWLRRSEPRARRGIVAMAESVHAASPGLRDRLLRLADSVSSHRSGKSRWWLAAALIAAAAIAVVAGRSFIAHDESPRHGHVWEQLRAMVGGKASRVNVLVEHGLEDGTVEISENGGVLLSESLRAPKKELFGASFLSYRSGTDESKFRLAAGSHELTVRIRGRDTLELDKTLDVRVDPKSEYDLRISVKTWPMERISADWAVIKERDEP
jgi:serine/threonine protein kinase